MEVYARPRPAQVVEERRMPTNARTDADDRVRRSQWEPNAPPVTLALDL